MYNLIQKNGLTLNKPDEGEKTLFLDLDNKVKTLDSDGVIEVINFTTADTPLVYKALLTQTGTDAPVATVLENTLGGTVVYAFSSTGVFTATLTGAFPLATTLIVLNSNTVAAVRTSDNVITLTGASNGLLTDTTFLIEVYQ